MTERARFASIGSPYFGVFLAVMAVVLVLSNIGGSKGVQLGPIILYKTAVEFLFVPLTALVIRWVKRREPSYADAPRSGGAAATP